MNISYRFFITLFVLTLPYSPLLAQNTNPFFLKSITHKKASLGLGYGLGFATMQLNEINQRLQELQIGQLTDVQVNVPFYCYIENKYGAGFSIDGSVGISPENEVYKPDTYLDFQTMAFGLTGHIPLIYSNRIGFWATGGIRNTNMYFQYNFKASASPTFNNLLTNPAIHNNSINLLSASNQMAAFGAKFQYRFWRKDKVKPFEIRLGFISEYSYSYSQDPWRERSSKTIIANMPNISPKNFNFNIILSMLGTLKSSRSE